MKGPPSQKHRIHDLCATVNARMIGKKKNTPAFPLTSGAFLAPSLLILAGVLVYPLGCAFFFSLTDKTMADPAYSWIGPGNYQKLLSDPKFWNALRHSLLFTVVAGSLNILVGFAVALLMNRKFPLRGLFRSLLLIPWVMPPIVTGLMFRWLYNDFYGYLNFVLTQLHLIDKPILFLVDPKYVWPALVLPTVWIEYPFVMLMFMAALQSIDPDLYRAARVDGAGSFQQFLHITLPNLKRAFLLNGLLQIIFMFKTFNLVWIITEGGPGGSTELLSTLAYRTAFDGFMTGYGSAIASIIFFVLFAATVLYLSIPATRMDGAR